MIAKSHRWQKTAVAAAAIALLGLSSSEAWALSLGRITVQSALGEPLRAEIDVPEINAEEAASLKTSVASPEAFAAAGLEYNAAMASLQASLQRRADGRAYIRMTSDRPINDPFVDMIVEASWSSGRILRDYTMLFDPPVLRNKAPAAATLPQISNTPSVTNLPKTPAPVAPTATEPARTTAPATRPATPTPPPRPVASQQSGQSGDGKQVVVKPGDTASKIANNTKAAGVSLDQMLVALLRANPDAFVHSNINRIRSGAVLDVPSTEQAQKLSTAEATQTVIAQSKDFNEFRRSLATNAPAAAVAAPTRKTGGAIDTKVEDRKTAVAKPDVLTLSKGAIQAKANEAKIAKERADKEAAARTNELNKNISDLKKIGGASAVAKAAVPAPAPAVVAASQPKAVLPSAPTVAMVSPVPAAMVAPSIPVAAVASAPAVKAASAPSSAPVAAASAAAPASAVATASAPASAAAPVSAPVKPKVVVGPPPEPVEPPGMLEELLDNPWAPYGLGLLLAAIGGFAFWKVRQRKRSQSHMDSSFLESRLQPDSFFGASGGQRVDTNNENSATGSSMVYSASQLDAADDVDPVAEADVYLAYGRDLQAEEILREAVRTNPGRLAIHTKLLEIFAKRRDAKNFEATASHAFQLTGANSPDWVRICEMGMGFDPTNPLYQPGGAPSSQATQPIAAATPSAFGNSTVAQPARADLTDSVSGVDLDLDLDFSLDEEPASAHAELSHDNFSQAKVEQTVKMPTPAAAAVAEVAPSADLDMDFDLSMDEPSPAPVHTHTPAPAPTLDHAMPEISLSMDGLSLSNNDHHPLPEFNATAPAPVAAPAAPAQPAAVDSGMLEFDLGSLSLDLDSPSEQPTEAPDSVGEDPLETKLALAEEFVSIGDEDGARALIEEVVSEATGEMRAKAQRALANLS